MGIHAGMLNFDRKPIDPATGATITRMLALGPQETVNVQSRPGLLMVEQTGHPDSPGERGPRKHIQADPELFIAWDGRLDNRDDFILRLDPGGRSVPPDSTLVVEAYRRWGTAVFEMLIGDWSVALWDGSIETLFLACDYMSVRPLHYETNTRSLMWSSLLRPLAAIRGRHNDISGEYVASLLLSGQSPMCATPFSGIKAVPAAHVVSARRDGIIAVRRYWNPTTAKVYYQRSSSYEEALRAALVDAVRCRVRAQTAVWAELSGGIDSSSIVCIAHALALRSTHNTAGLRLVSQVSDDGLGGDETRFIRAIEEHTHSASHYISSRDSAAINLPQQHWASPEEPFGARVAGLIAVANNGGTTLLSGRAGDTVMWNNYDSSEALLEHLSNGSIHAFWSDLRKVCFANDQTLINAARKLIWSALGGRMDESGQTAEDRARMTQLTLLRDELISDEATATDNHWSDLWRTVPVPKRRLFSGLARYSTFRLLRSPSDFHAVRYTYPYAHRPLVELVLAMPALAQWQPGHPRALMRRALADIVPATVLDRRAKGYYVPADMRHLRSFVTGWLMRVEALEVVRRGWVDPRKLQAALVAAESGVGFRFWPLRWVIRLETWLSTLAADRVISFESEMKGGDTHVQQAAASAGWNG